MSTLSELAGGVFGADVGAGVRRYMDWADAIVAAFAPPATVSRR
jgi:hypothetical protein